MKIIHWNYFKKEDNQSGAKRYEEEIFTFMSFLNVSRIRRHGKNIIEEAKNFKIDDSDIVHATFQPLAPLKIIKKPKNFVLTVHDIIPEYHYTMPQKIKHMWYMIRKSIPKADKIIVYSEYNKQELIKHLGVKEDKIHIAHLGVTSKYKPLDKFECKGFFDFNPNINYILVVASNAPWKNMELVNKIADLIVELRLDNYKIVKIGYGEKLTNPNIICLGYVEEKNMPMLYNACDLFLQPSLGEGALPILEAMGCGCPVVSADAASLREITGTAGILLNAEVPNAEHDFLITIHTILEDKITRESMAEKGIERAKQFPWSRTTNEIIEVYESFN